MTSDPEGSGRTGIGDMVRKRRGQAAGNGFAGNAAAFGDGKNFSASCFSNAGDFKPWPLCAWQVLRFGVNMTRLLVLLGFFAALWVPAAAWLPVAAAAPSPERPNVVLILTDNHGA